VTLPHASVAVGLAKFTTALLSLALTLVMRSGGHTRVGGAASTTMSVVAQELLAPRLSMTVTVTMWRAGSERSSARERSDGDRAVRIERSIVESCGRDIDLTVSDGVRDQTPTDRDRWRIRCR
jgi:hypothetical protein